MRSIGFLLFTTALMLFKACGPSITNLSISSDLRPLIAGRMYQGTLKVNGGTPPYRWTSAGIPPWLTLSSSGTLLGQVPADLQGSITFIATVQDSGPVSRGIVSATAEVRLAVNRGN